MTTSKDSPYHRMFARSLEHPEEFWAEAAAPLRWSRPHTRVLDENQAPLYSWFRGGKLNTCVNAVDRHVEEGHGDRLALIYDSPLTDSVQRYSYAQLLDQVSRVAGALKQLSVGKGDRVLIYMPMVPEAVFGMLACARLGAVHSVVFGGFAARELATRIDDAKPRVVLSASCGIEPARVVEYMPLLDEALKQAEHRPESCVILQRDRHRAPLVTGRDHDWKTLVEAAAPAAPVEVDATDPLYILYTSGTTGKPKGVVRDNGGHAVALRWSLENVYGMKPGEVFWAASDIGWVVGHSYIVYAPLLLGCTTVLYEGKPVGTPDAGAFWRVVSEHGVNALFTAPTAFRAIRRVDPEAKETERYDLSSLRTLFLAGERADPATVSWAEQALDVPVIDHWWQTETGWPIVANCRGIEALPVKHGSPTVPVPGFRVAVVDDEGELLPRGTGPEATGNVVISLPLPPGCLPTLWNDDDGYRNNYLERFPGYYQTSDAGYIDEDGYVWITCRTDDVINVAGHRLSTGTMEEVLASDPDVAEAAVVGAKDTLKGQVPLGLVVPSSASRVPPEELTERLVGLVREKVGPVAAMKQVRIVQALPKTRSGKVLRRVVRQMADGEPFTTPPTIEDASVLDDLAQLFADRSP